MLQFALARGIGEVSIKKAIAFIESNNLSWDDFIQDRNLLYHFGLKENVIIGRLIPAGTGIIDYDSIKIESDEPDTTSDNVSTEEYIFNEIKE